MIKRQASFQHSNSLPFVERKKSGVDVYVSERLKKIRIKKNRQPKEEPKPKTEKNKVGFRDLVEDVYEDKKKNIIVSPNKIISNQHLMASVEPFRKELDFLRRKKNATISYEEMMSNLHPFSNAIRELGFQRLQQEREKRTRKRNSDHCASVNLYRSIPKRKNNFREQLKPISETCIKKDQTYFFNVEKMNLYDNEHKNEIKLASRKNEYPSSAFGVQIEPEMATIQFTKLNHDKSQKFLKGQSTQTKFQSFLLRDQKKQFVFSPPKKKKKFNVPFETYHYRNLIWKVNFSNHLNVQVPMEYEHRLRVYVGKGNNSGLVRGLIKRRFWFAFTERLEDANFVWTQLKSLPYFRIQKRNLIEEPLYQNEKVYEQKSILTLQEKDQIKKYMEIYATVQEKGDQRFLCRNKHFKYDKMIKTIQIKETKVHNHFINNYVIGNKKALFHTLNAYYNFIGEDVFDYLPLSFHIREGLEDPVYFKFLKYFYKRQKQINKINSERPNKKQYNIWIVKPGENSNRGKGINVCLNLEEIKAIVKKKQRYYDGSYRTYIVQKYIERPLLFHKRKFDIRHYIMMTCVNGVMKGYWYQDGYLRTTSSEYNLSTNCGKIHLTNDAVQKNLPDYGKYEKGNKLSYDDLEAYIQKSFKKNQEAVSFKKVLLPKMKKIATDTMKACSLSIDPERRENNFEIFGLDFMIDAHFKLYLIEVNSNPCLEISCPLLGAIVPRMIENALELTLDARFPPPVRYYPKGVYYFKDLQKQNKFELVFDSRYEPTYNCSMDAIDEKLLEEEDDTFEDDGDEYEWDD